MQEKCSVAYLVWQTLNPLCILKCFNFMIFADLTDSTAVINVLINISSPVVCLRGGERGTCLGPSFLGAPFQVLQA